MLRSVYVARPSNLLEKYLFCKLLTRVIPLFSKCRQFSNNSIQMHSLALIQAIFHVGDRFWAQENRRPKIKKTIFKGSSALLR